MSACFFGHKLARSVSFVCGCIVGGAGVYWLFSTQTGAAHFAVLRITYSLKHRRSVQARHPGTLVSLPCTPHDRSQVAVALLGAFLGGLFSLLIYFVSLPALLGYVAAAVIIVVRFLCVSSSVCLP